MMRGELKMKKRKALKGFTLIEMMIVVAIFGMIIAVVLGMVDPVRKVYNNTYNEADTQAISENLRRYVGDQIQYADRMALYTGMALDGAATDENSVEYQVNEFRKRYYFVSKTEDVNVGGTLTPFTKERIYPYARFKGHDEVFVLHISNPLMDLSTTSTLPVSSRLGTVTLTTYTGGTVTSSRVWSSNTDYYDDYAFDISLQTVASVAGTDDEGNPVTEHKYIDLDETVSSGRVSPTNIAMGIKMYRKHPMKPDFVNASVDDSFTNRTITFKLKNLITKTDALSYEIIGFQDSTHFPTEERVSRFEWYDNTKTNSNKVTSASESNDIYFIFTKAPVIEDVI